MRIRETTRRKDKRFNLEKNRYLSHFYRYTPSGEELPEKHDKRISQKIFYSGLAYLPLNYVVTRIPEAFHRFEIIPGSLQGVNIFSYKKCRSYSILIQLVLESFDPNNKFRHTFSCFYDLCCSSCTYGIENGHVVSSASRWAKRR